MSWFGFSFCSRRDCDFSVSERENENVYGLYSGLPLLRVAAALQVVGAAKQGGRREWRREYDTILPC